MDDLIGLALLAIAGFLIVYTYWTYPVSLPYFKSRNKPTKPLMVLFQKNGVMRLLTGRYLSQTYELEDEKMVFAKNDADAFRLGECVADLFYDGANMAQKPIFWLALQELKRMGYKTQNEVKEAFRKGGLKPTGDQEIGVELEIDKRNIDKEGNLIKIKVKGIGEVPEGTIFIPLFSQVSPHSVLGFMEGTPSINYGYAATKVNEVRAERFAGVMNNPNVMILVLVIIAACVGLAILKATGVI